MLMACMNGSRVRPLRMLNLNIQAVLITIRTIAPQRRRTRKISVKVKRSIQSLVLVLVLVMLCLLYLEIMHVLHLQQKHEERRKMLRLALLLPPPRPPPRPPRTSQNLACHLYVQVFLLFSSPHNNLRLLTSVCLCTNLIENNIHFFFPHSPTLFFFLILSAGTTFHYDQHEEDA